MHSELWHTYWSKDGRWPWRKLRGIEALVTWANWAMENGPWLCLEPLLNKGFVEQQICNRLMVMVRSRQSPPSANRLFGSPLRLTLDSYRHSVSISKTHSNSYKWHVGPPQLGTYPGRAEWNMDQQAAVFSTTVLDSGQKAGSYSKTHEMIRWISIFNTCSKPSSFLMNILTYTYTNTYLHTCVQTYCDVHEYILAIAKKMCGYWFLIIHSAQICS